MRKCGHEKKLLSHTVRAMKNTAIYKLSVPTTKSEALLVSDETRLDLLSLSARSFSLSSDQQDATFPDFLKPSKHQLELRLFWHVQIIPPQLHLHLHLLPVIFEFRLFPAPPPKHRPPPTPEKTSSDRAYLAATSAQQRVSALIGELFTLRDRRFSIGSAGCSQTFSSSTSSSPLKAQPF